MRPRHATSRAIVPVEAVSPPRGLDRTNLKDREGSLTPALRHFFPRRLTLVPARSPIRDVASGNDLMVVVTSVGTEEQALDVAHALVRARRAACVNIIPNVHSIYRWKGRVCDDGEMLLLIKTRSSNFESVRETIHRVNTYELPEVLGYRVDWASPGFTQWIEKMTKSPLRPAVRKRPRKGPGAAKARPAAAKARKASRSKA